MTDSIVTSPDRLKEGWTPETVYTVTLRMTALEWARLQLTETTEILKVESSPTITRRR